MSRAEWWRAALVACLLGLQLPSAAHAQATPAAAPSQDYQAAIDQAPQEFQYGNFSEMYAAMRRAHELEPSARTERGMGTAAYELKDYVAAITNFRAALADTRKPLTDIMRSEMLQQLKNAEVYVDAYTLTLTPSQASFTVDGLLPTFDEHGALLLALGKHVLEVSASGYETAQRTVQSLGGKTQTLTVELQPVGANAAQPQAPLAATTTQVDTTSGSQRTWGFISLGVASGFAIGSGIALAVRQSAANKYNSDACRPQRSVTCKSDADRVHTMQTLGIVGASAAVALAATSVVLLLLPNNPAAPEARDHAQASCGVGLASVARRGTF